MFHRVIQMRFVKLSLIIMCLGFLLTQCSFAQTEKKDKKEKDELVRVLCDKFSGFTKSRIQAKRILLSNGKVSETYDITIGDNLQNCRCTVKKTSNNKLTGNTKTEWILGGGQWISNTELELRDSIYYTGEPNAGDGFLLQRNVQPTFVFGYVQNQDRQFDLRKPGFFDVAKLVRRTNSQSLIVQDSEGSTLRFDFQSANQGPVLTGISLKFDGKALRPSGGFED
ncbi:MAG: hypothetical protein ACI87E_003139, partial [Mariniblastus sp.]